jgi:hypothetical protein
MIDELIKKYKKIISDLGQFSKGEFENGHFRDSQEIDVEISIHKRFLKDLEKLKTEYKKVLNDTGDTPLNNFLGVDIDE